MNKAELIAAVAAAAEISKKDAETAVTATLDTITTALKDPDAADGGEERYSIDNVAFTELPFMNYKMGEVNQQKLPFTFRPSDLVCLDSIRAAD